jgi:hypothetical protein
MNKPHLLHKGRRVTTDATLASDLKASVEATSQKAKLEKLERALQTINENQITMIDVFKELVRGHATMTARVDRILASMEAVVASAQRHFTEDVQ